MIATPKKYFRLEKLRNQESAALFEKMIKHAFGAHNAVIVGHHLTFEDTRGTTEENILTENEIPSADTLIFDHDVMRECFGDDAMGVMTALATVTTEYRDKLLQKFWEMYGPHTKVEPKPEIPKRVQAFNAFLDEATGVQSAISSPTPAGNYSEANGNG